MELTNLKHTLTIASTDHEIDEPVGFADLSISFRRGEYHGMTIEATDTDLEFYDSLAFKAASILKAAYESDIETEIKYKAFDRTTNEVAYEGIVDLSTYNENQSNYFSVRCKVGEISVKTTFNNRIDTAIDLDAEKTLDGATLAHNTNLWKKILIPPKTILYQNRVTQQDALIWSEATSPTGRFHLAAAQNYQFIGMQLNTVSDLAEFGSFSVGMADIASDIIVPPGEILENLYISDYYQSMYDIGEESTFAQKYGANVYDIDIDILIGLTCSGKLFDDSIALGWTGKDLCYDCKLVLIDATHTFNTAMQSPIAESNTFRIDNTLQSSTIQIPLQVSIQSWNTKHLLLGIIMYANPKETQQQGGGAEVERPAGQRILATPMVASNLQEGTFAMSIYSHRDDRLEADMMPIHEAANKIAEAISENEITVASDYYSRQDSPVNPHAVDASGVGLGGGSLKALTSGIKMRSNGDRLLDINTVLSFKDMIEALSCIDCIGWCFEESAGTTKVRIEPWNYFYKDTVVLTLTSPNGMTRSIDGDTTVTGLTIGYKKYVESAEINSADTIHGERVFKNNSKVMTKDVNKLCSFTADIYAIEQTRRKALANDTSNFKYDETIFILELKAERVGAASPYSLAYHVADKSILPSSYAFDINLIYPEECYNLRISPRRNAGRWCHYIGQFNSARDFQFISGTMNYKAFYAERPNGVNSTDGKYYFYHGVDLDNGSMRLYENGAVANDDECIIRKEAVRLSYPLSLAEYRQLKANPYGIIRVDGEDYWLKEAKYQIRSGLTEFSLIPKNS